MADNLYDGPIVDPHHHLWDRSLHRHAWLEGASDPALADQLPADYRAAGKMYPQSPWAPNNLAWLLATRAEFDQPTEAGEAVDNALRAVSIERDANNLDTLACAYARKGDFTSAVAVARDVVGLAPNNDVFKQRLKKFEASPPKNCVGED